MEEHLNDEQLTLALLGESPGETRAHLESCATCREEQAALERAVAEFGGTTRRIAERPEAFWQGQASAIRSRLAEPQSQPRRLAWAGALAVLVVVAVLLSKHAPPKTTVTQADPDHVLLVDVERAVRRELPRALEPAALLAQEVSRSSGAESNP